MRVAVDAMGGDFAPREIVRGCVEAVRRLRDVEEIILVGDRDAIQTELARCRTKADDGLRITHASEAIAMGESPATAVRRKRDSSINRCVELVRDRQADAMVSAGNTGAVVASALLHLGRIKGVLRPAIGAVLPTRSRPLLLIDAGANIDCDERLLAQFALLGSVYAHSVMRQPEPVVGLLSIGTEDSKGNEVTRKALSRIQGMGLHFRGNVEGHDLLIGETDVVVCDGFVGNVVLKTTESVAHAIGHWMNQEFFGHPIRMLGALLLKGALKAMKRRMDPEIYGGAPLLGVDGIVIITHGSSSQRAIFYAVQSAAAAVSGKVSERIAARIAELGESGAGPAGPGEDEEKRA